MENRRREFSCQNKRPHHSPGAIRHLLWNGHGYHHHHQHPLLQHLLLTRLYFSVVRFFRQLLEDPKVLFAGYKMPHPLDHYFILKVQTTPDTTPAHVLGNAVTELIQNVGSMKNKFEVRSLQIIIQRPEGSRIEQQESI